MSMTIIVYIGKAAVTKLIEAGFKKAMGVELQGSTVGDWAETLALAVLPGPQWFPNRPSNKKLIADSTNSK